MSRYMTAITVLYALKKSAWPRLLDDEKAAIDQALNTPESEGEKAIREGDEMIEEAYRMNF